MFKDFAFKRIVGLTTLAGFIACALSSGARAQLIAYEPFDYATGGLVDVAGGPLGGGTGWADTTLNPTANGWYFESVGGTPNPVGTVVDAAPPDWGYTDSQGNKLPTTGGRAEVVNWQNFVRQFDLTGVDPALTNPPVNEFGFDKLGVDGTSVWISFLGQGTEISGAASLGLGETFDQNWPGYDRAVEIGRPYLLLTDGTTGESNDAWGILDTGPHGIKPESPKAATGDPYDDQVFFVTRVDFDGAGNSFGDETLTVWVNPDLGSATPSEASAKISDWVVWDFDFNAIRLSGNANTFYDEIRIGLTYGDVAPIAASGSSADFDGDGDVDGSDFLEWQRGFGTDYDATDLANWQNEYGTAGEAALLGITAVPEPGGSLLACMFALALADRLRWRVRLESPSTQYRIGRTLP